jgi:hypothetical protein
VSQSERQPREEARPQESPEGFRSAAAVGTNSTFAAFSLLGCPSIGAIKLVYIRLVFVFIVIVCIISIASLLKHTPLQ